jgi:sulfotransferase
MLAAILRQNPRFHGAMSSPLENIFVAALRTMSNSETGLFMTDEQREQVLRSIVESYYFDASSQKVIFDTNRGWCGQMPALAKLFPESRVICCLRNPAWILDSIERLVQKNALLAAKMFGDVSNVVARVDSMKATFLGNPMNCLRQAWYGEHAGNLVGIRYESFTADPHGVMKALYSHLGEEWFEHDFDHLDYDEPEFDARLNMPGLHRVAARIEVRKRETILPPDIFSQNDRCFWDMPGQNPRSVIVL